MFGKKKKSDAQPTVAQAGANIAPDVVEQIRVMPERFYLAPRSRSNKTFLLVGVAVIVVGLLTAVALAIWKFGPAPVEQEAPLPDSSPALTPTPEATVPPIAEPTVAPTAEPTIAPTVQPTETPSPSPTPSGPSGASDEDNDGLSLDEERLYTTQPTVSDSDGDSYSDGDEIRKGYSPRDPSGRTLVADGLFTAVATSGGFRWAFPTAWLAQESTEGGVATVRLDTKTGETMVAERHPMSRLSTLLQRWGNPQVLEFSANGVAGARTADAIPRYYFVTPDKSAVVAVTYATGSSPSFSATFEAIIGTFRWGP
ncbi:MAG: allergen V5/Tpx-1-like protein [Parcubacteria group bacterium Gr01-1014_31]|nr:MAG: allergen V5/Tpx-1-like protein [Parcubacteria group bacterium Gr01-1014_31]